MKNKNVDKKNIKKKRKRKLIIFLILLLIIAGTVFYVYSKYFKKSETKVEEKTKVVDTINEYDYTIRDNDTKLYKTKFEELKRTLNAKNLDNKKYSELVSELFIIDFYSLDNKISKNDVGGVQYVYSEYKPSFIEKARDEFYKFVKNNLNDDRNQKLPIVSTIKVESSEQVSAGDYFKSDNLKYKEEAYKIELSWTYEEDLGYDKKATIIVVKDGDKKFSVAKLIGSGK